MFICLTRSGFTAGALSLFIAVPGSCQRLDAASQREDLAAFRRDFLAVDQSFAPSARAEAERRVALLEREAGSIGATRFRLALEQIAALADNGHTRVMAPWPTLERVGVRLSPFGSDFYVLRAVAEHADLLGGRLVAIDGVPIERLRDSARTLSGGPAARRDRFVPATLESPDQLNALGLIRNETHATYAFVMPNGQRRELPLEVVRNRAGGSYDALSAMSPIGAEFEGWRSLLPPDRAPWSLQEPAKTMRRRDAPELNAVVIQLRANLNGEIPIAVFLEASDSARRIAGRKNVVLDMRMNGGGNLQLTREFMSSLPKRLPADGRIVVLTSPWTFSAAISSVGYLKQAGGDRVTLVGEAPGDRLRFFAEGGPRTLPRSGVFVMAATQRHDYVTGCVGFNDCHAAVVRYPIAVKNLDPEIAAPWTLEAYAAGRDPGMEAAARLLSPPR
jgi:hypothetical protein